MTSDPLVRYQARSGARFERAERLRPMSTGEMLDLALRVYQRQGLTFLRLTALPSVLCLGALAFVTDYVLPALGSTRDASSLSVQAGEVALMLALSIFVAGPVFMTGLTYGSALVVSLVSDLLEGRPSDEDRAFEVARKSLPMLFWLSVRELLVASSGILFGVCVMLLGALLTAMTSEESAAAGVVAILGIFFLIGGFILFALVFSRHALALPACVIEGVAGVGAARRSVQLLRAAKTTGGGAAHPNGYSAIWSLYGILVLVMIGIVVALATAYGLLGIDERLAAAFAGSWMKSIVMTATDLGFSYLAIWPLIPIWACALTVIYYERRIRVEGYDIEVLASYIPNDDRASRFNV